MEKKEIKEEIVIDKYDTESYKRFLEEELNPRFAKLARMIKSDLALLKSTKSNFFKIKKEKLIDWIQNPQAHESDLRNLSIALYSQSTYYRRLIDYQSHIGLDNAYIIKPYKLPQDKSKITKSTFKNNYSDHLNIVDNMNIAHEYKKIKEQLWLTGIFYGYERETEDSYFIQKLDPDYCRINGIVDGSFVYEFNFSYFSTHLEELSSYSQEFQKKYNDYTTLKDNRKKPAFGGDINNYAWIEISPEKSICLKLDETITYNFPPFIGLFLDIYDIQDYKELKKAKEELQNYAMFVAKIPLGNSGNPDDFLLSLDKAIEFGNKFATSLPDQVGLALSVFENVEFHKLGDKGASDKNAVAEAEKTFWNGSGTNQNMFSGETTTGDAMNFSVKSDEISTFSINRQFERWINRKFKYVLGSRKYLFGLCFLDVTIFNYKDKFSLYSQAVATGAPAKLQMMAVLGETPSSFDNMLYLESEILDLTERMVPPLTSNVLSGKAGTNPNGGRPSNETVDNNGGGS